MPIIVTHDEKVGPLRPDRIKKKTSAKKMVKKFLNEGAKNISDADRRRVNAILKKTTGESAKTISDADRRAVKKAQFGGMISPRPGRATVDSMRALGRNPQRTLSPRDDMRVANYLTRNIRPQPFNVEDASVQDYVRFNDGGMASKTKVY